MTSIGEFQLLPGGLLLTPYGDLLDLAALRGDAATEGATDRARPTDDPARADVCRPDPPRRLSTVQRHPFDPVSAALGVLAVLAGLLVALGDAADLDASGPWWLAAAAVVIGLAVIPWRRAAAADPAVDVSAAGGAAPDDGTALTAEATAADGRADDLRTRRSRRPGRLADSSRVVDAGPLLRIDGLTKRYPGVTALDDLTRRGAARAHRARRRQRRRQDDDVPPAARPRPPDRGSRRGVRHRRRRAIRSACGRGSATCPSTTACRSTRPRPTSWRRSAS